MSNKYEEPNRGQRDGWLTSHETSWNEVPSSIDTLEKVEWEHEEEFYTIPKSLKDSNVSVVSFPRWVLRCRGFVVWRQLSIFLYELSSSSNAGRATGETI